MIAKIGRGRDTAGLLRYLFGPGRANEHTDPHVVAAWDPDVEGERWVGGASRDRAEITRLAKLMDQPLALLAGPQSAAGARAARAGASPATVWHCSLRAAPGDRRLSDAEWADVARDVLDRAGLVPRGEEAGCRWVAVRHAEDHVHLAVTLVREDGSWARAANDFVKVGAICREVEGRYGLTRTPPRDRTAPRRPSRAEVEKARRVGQAVTTRDRLRRQVRDVALASRDVDGFVAGLRERGVLVRLRCSQVDDGVVTGYSVADPAERTAAGEPVWFGGAKLSPALSLPRLAEAWSGDDSRGRLHAPARGLVTGRGRTASWSRGLRSAAGVVADLERGDLLNAGVATWAAASKAARRR